MARRALRPRQPPLRPARGMALSGLRVADFTWAWAGPYATTMLADFGAEVINVEAWPRTSNMRSQPPFKGGAVSIPNGSGWWSTNQRNKLSCTLDLKRPEGLALAKRLVAISDVAIENFAPGVLERLGLGYEELRRVRPDIILVSMSGFGGSGPHSSYVAYGNHLAMAAGLAHISGFPGGNPAQVTIPYGDPIGGLTGALAALAALQHRTVTGQGQYIDVSQHEALASLVPEPLLDYALNGRVMGRRGNRDDDLAPHGCYPCKEENTWVTIAAASDGEWLALCRALGDPEWARDSRFEDSHGRWLASVELDARLEEWTRPRTAEEAATLLQQHGVAAAPSHSGASILADPHLRARRFFVRDESPEVAGKLMQGPAWKMSATPGRVRRGAPLLGRDNDYVLRRLLGLSAREIAALREEKVVLA
ncbi:MAG: CoA transferase [Chloroflexi bacterium]|nr:CoA transferase [Chloroflexota bacterium]